jgi:putative transcriptional regulator
VDVRKELIKKIYEFLKQNGFNVSEPDLYGLVTFDIVCRRDGEKYIIKVLYNIDTFSKLSVSSLLKMEKITGSIAVIIGEKTGTGALEDGVLYFRHGLPIFSFQTFKEYINGQKPYIYSAPGGFYVKIDGEKMREIRNSKNFSIGYISQKLGVSRRSISLYESGSSATIDIYLKLENILGDDISREVDISTLKENINVEEEDINDVFIKEVFKIINSFGYISEYISRNPFNGLSYDVQSFLMIGAFNNAEENSEKIMSIKKISDVLGDIPVIINRTYSTRENIYGCPVVNIRDLMNINDRDTFKKILVERL